MRASEREWLEVREWLRGHRRDLDRVAAAGYPDAVRAADSALLSRESWLPREPVPLEAIRLVSDETPGAFEIPKSSCLPARGDDREYTTYSETMRELAPPKVFDNRMTYRLLYADLVGSDPVVRFGMGQYFDGIDWGEAAAHEFALQQINRDCSDGVRTRISDPCDLNQRPVNMAISTLTIRREGTDSQFYLHWRDPKKVGHAGGSYQVVPVGVFQPSHSASWNLVNDFSLWRAIIRECAEELAGHDEDYGSDTAPIDYRAWPFASQFDRARRTGAIEGYCVGLGVDPLTFATDLLTVVFLDAPVFDELFTQVLASNSEGEILRAKPFTVQALADCVAEYPMQAAGHALLRLAAEHFL